MVQNLSLSFFRYLLFVDGNPIGFEDSVQVVLSQPGEHEVLLIGLADNGCLVTASGESALTVHPSPFSSFEMEIDELTGNHGIIAEPAKENNRSPRHQGYIGCNKKPMRMENGKRVKKHIIRRKFPVVHQS